MSRHTQDSKAPSGQPEPTQGSVKISSLDGLRVWIASDHAGFILKEKIKALLPQIAWEDAGPSDSSQVDYPDFADRLVQKMISSIPQETLNSLGEARGVLICGSGQGMAIRANRYRAIRAALAWNEDVARLARQHNNANVLCLGARITPPETAKRLVEVFLLTPFEGGRHERRVEKLNQTVERSCK